MDPVFYLARHQTDGRFTVFNVDIFGWGPNQPIAPLSQERREEKLKPFTEEWIRQAVSNYEKLRAENGHAAPAHFDHNEDSQETSRDLIGFVTDLKIGDGRGDVITQTILTPDGFKPAKLMRAGRADRVYATLRNIPKDTFEKLKEWPYRSVEVLDPAVPMFSSLAFLRSIPPFFCFRPLVTIVDESETAPDFHFEQSGLESVRFAAKKQYFYVQNQHYKYL